MKPWMLRLIRDVFLLSVVALLFAWHFRDKAGVQNQRPAVEYVLKRAGMEPEPCDAIGHLKAMELIS